MNSYEEPWLAERPRPGPADDFGFNEVDDFLTQTLNSLQDLDIPVGEPSMAQQSQHGQYHPHGYAPPVRGHKKQPSGTAIFGFVQHNKTLSIPGTQHNRNPSVSRQVVAPQQVFQQKHNQPIKQEPVLFQNPHDLHMAQMYNAQKDMAPAYQYQLYPPQPPQQDLAQPVRPPQPQRPQQADDYIVTNKTPYGYKFPPDQHSNMGSGGPQYLRQPPGGHPYYQSQYPPQQPRMGPPPPQSQQQGQGSPQKTVQVPVEYLQKLTSMIKNTNGVNMENFLGYDFEKLESSARPELAPSSPQRAPSEISPVLKTYESSSGSSNPHSREPTPEYLGPVSTHQLDSSPMRPNMAAHVSVLSSPPKQAKFIHSAKSIGLGISQDSGKDLAKECPKTPSPTLRSQATFISSPVKNDLSWTPVVIGTGENTGAVTKKKIHDKVSTLPPGQIDQYVLGPREDKTFICTYNGCGKMFTRRYNVRSHVQTHLSDRPFLCQVPGCNKAFVRQHDLTRHKKIHQELAFQCVCGKKFSRHDALFRHRARNICSGGLKPEEVARIELRQAQTSVQKKRTGGRPSIKVANDTVAKRLEFDLLKVKKNGRSQSTPASPQSRKVSGASTVSDFDEEDEDGEIHDQEDEEDEEEEDEEEESDEEEHANHVGCKSHDLQLGGDSLVKGPTSTQAGLDLMHEFTTGGLQVDDGEDNVFLNDLNFDGFDYAGVTGVQN